MSALTPESPSDLANCVLQESPYLPIRKLVCTCRGETLVIGGRLPSFYMKQIALIAVQTVCGERRIVDCIEVSV